MGVSASAPATELDVVQAKNLAILFSRRSPRSNGMLVAVHLLIRVSVLVEMTQVHHPRFRINA